MRILIVEDERMINDIIARTLRKENYSVDSCFDGEEALDYIFSTEYDVLILDIMLPKLDGFEVLKRIRNKGIQTPVLFLTARESVQDRVKGLDYGADDYLVKPFDFEELLARIRVILRKNSIKSDSVGNVFKLANLTVDCNTHTVYRDEKKIKLSPKEFSKKIDTDFTPKLIHKIRGVGYVLKEENE